MRQTLALAATLLLLATQAGAAERLGLKMVSVKRSGDSTVVAYSLTNKESHSIDFVRVECDLLARHRQVIDEAVDINTDLGPGETVSGETEFNAAEAVRGRTFACHIGAAYRDK